MIVTDGLVAGYGAGSEPVLRGIDLRVGRGESVAVMGRSGSGKSTLLYALAGILPISSGVVEVAGERVWDLPDRARTRHRLSRLGFVFEFPEMVPELSLAENVALPLELLRPVRGHCGPPSAHQCRPITATELRESGARM